MYFEELPEQSGGCLPKSQQIIGFLQYAIYHTMFRESLYMNLVVLKDADWQRARIQN